MKTRALIFASYLGLFTLHAQAADDSVSLSTQQEKLSYSLGLEVGKNVTQSFKQQSINIPSAKAFAKGIEDAIDGNMPAMTPKQMEETLTAFQEKQEQVQQQSAQKNIVDNSNALFNSNSPVSGDKTGTTTLVEFFDYQCVHCRRMSSVVAKLSKGDPKLRIVYKEFPILGESSLYASKAALAAQKQGKYLALHKSLLASQGSLTEQSVLNLAKSAGLNVDKLKQDMEDPSVMKEIEANYTLAKNLGIQGTPGFVIANTSALKKANAQTFFVPGATDFKTLADMIEKAQGDGFTYSK